MRHHHDFHVQIPDTVWNRAKQRAKRDGKTMKQLVTELLVEYTKRKRERS